MIIEEVKQVEEEVKKEIKEEVKSDEEDKGLQPINNGLVLENYKWTQNHKDISIFIKLPKNIRGKDVDVKFNHDRLYVNIRGQDKPIINGQLFSLVKSENCTWLIDDGELIIELDKKKFDEWWKCVIIGEPIIDLAKIITEQGSVSDLDQETRMTIDKMLYEQKIKEEQGFYKDMKR